MFFSEQGPVNSKQFFTALRRIDYFNRAAAPIWTVHRSLFTGHINLYVWPLSQISKFTAFTKKFYPLPMVEGISRPFGELTILTVRQHRYELFTVPCLLFTQKSLTYTKNPVLKALVDVVLEPITEINEPCAGSTVLWGRPVIAWLW